MSTVGERIKQLRMELGLSADELAEKVGKNRATIFRYESGDIENMSIEVISLLSKALGTTPDVLMGWDNLPSNKDSSAEIEKAIKLYKKYKKAIPQVQDAVDALLKSPRSDS